MSTPPNTNWQLAERYFTAEAKALVDPLHPLWAEEFASGIETMRESYAQCGGHSRPVQGPAEVEAAHAAIDAGRSPHIHVLDEAAHWRVLLQIPEAEDLDVEVFALPNLGGVNVLIRGLLGDGVAASTRFDPQAKAVGEWLRSRHVHVPEELL